MQVWASMDQRMPLGEVADHARRVEAAGYAGLNVPESVHDGLLMSHAALAGTTRLRVATSVLVAFPRSPMSVAMAAWDLQAVSGGRFELGLGSQVRGNIVGRYSTAWAPPVPRMREYVLSLRAIFDCWQNGTPLHFTGEHYQFTRMQPFFAPGPLDCGGVEIHLGGIGAGMTALAGELADGLMCHPTNSSPRYLAEVVRPRLQKGALRSGRSAEAVQLMSAELVATGRDEAEVAAARAGIRALLGFLYSTPAYWPSLELYGWLEVGERLRSLSREGRWAEMTPLISDEMLDTLAPSAPYEGIAELLVARSAALASRITLPLPRDPTQDQALEAVIQALQAPKRARP